MTTDTRNTRVEFAQVWHMLTLAWPNTTHPPGQASLYAATLMEFDPAEVATVAAELIKLGGSFFPSSSDLYTRLVQRRDKAPDAVTAWTAALANASGKQAFTKMHPAVQEASRAVGGGFAIRVSTNPDAVRKHFRDAYETVLDRRRQDYANGRVELPPPPEGPLCSPVAARMLEAARAGMDTGQAQPSVAGRPVRPRVLEAPSRG